jgi:dipeptidyl aminopeptidase/acylaminoacyl peptidase
MLPAIVLPHGGPAARDYPEFDWWAQAFASRGYAVFQPNFRGSTGYGPKLERAGDGQWGRAMQTDISDGLADLVRQGLVDPKRVCIMGGSYGGYAALAGVTLQKGLYRCAVSVAGVSDLQDLAKREIHDSDQDQILSRQLDRQLGPFDALKAVSPIRLADHADAPILLIHGKDDTVVPYAQSVAMEKALKQQGKPVEFVTLPGEDHWLSRGATRLQMLTAADAFIERYNPPDANPAALAGR